MEGAIKPTVGASYAVYDRLTEKGVERRNFGSRRGDVLDITDGGCGLCVLYVLP